MLAERAGPLHARIADGEVQGDDGLDWDLREAETRDGFTELEKEEVNEVNERSRETAFTAWRLTAVP